MVKKVGGSEDEEDEWKPAGDRDDDDDEDAGDSRTEPAKSKHTTIPNLARSKRAKIISSDDEDENEHEQLNAKPDNTKANTKSVSRNLDTHDNNDSSYTPSAQHSTAPARPDSAAECASGQPTMVNAAYTALYSTTAYPTSTYQSNGMTPPPPYEQHVIATPQSSLGNVLSAAILEHNDLTQL